MNEIKLSENISYLKANSEPLSADIGIIKTKDVTWLYDVGNGIKNIEGLDDTYNVIISHFHLDHIGNLNNLKIDKLYVSKESYKHLPKEVIDKCEVIIVNEDLYINNLHIFILPSSHSKGSLGLEIDNRYAFIGDAAYCKTKNGSCSYNVQILKAEIAVLKNLNADKLLLSHLDGLIYDKSKLIANLEKIYETRKLKQTEIILNNDDLLREN